jgi:ubiquitin-conjugating enzyme E2 D/E
LNNHHFILLMAQTPGLRRLAKEYAMIQQKPIPNCDIHPDNGNLEKWVGTVQGPDNTPYKGGIFRVEFTIPTDYPHKPPQLRLLTPIYHMNVDDKGKACIDLLREEVWAASTKLSEVFEQVLALLANPNPAHAERTEIAQEYVSNKAAYEKKVRRFVAQHAK